MDGTAVALPVKVPADSWTPTANSVSSIVNSTTLTPSVETGLPVARRTPVGGVGSLSGVDSSTIPMGATLPSMGDIASGEHIVPPVKARSLGDNFTFTNFEKKTPKNTYPWKTNIITTIFWIGEGSTPISSTTNDASAWDEDWISSNSGSDSMYEKKSGYASAHHAATVNPFYIALPFNDLAFPDKSRQWLPRGWYRSPKNGRQVSACKDRWIEIKTEDGTGRTCYAQWEDVGPLRYDHAEYVFGSERPQNQTGAGLDVSPAVAEYLHLNDKSRYTRWRFVDDDDVLPGVWLKYDEQAVLFSAMKELKNTESSSAPSIQRSTTPIDDPANLDTNKKKVGAAKG